MIRGRLSFFDARPLAGKRVLLLRAKEQAHASAELLRRKGAIPVLLPVISIAPLPNPAEGRAAAGRLREFDWIVFTSANGVHELWRILDERGDDARAFSGVRIAAIGPGTSAALLSHGLRADFVSGVHEGEAFARELASRLAPSSKVLVARALVAREIFPEVLRAAGHSVTVLPVYETKGPVSADARNLLLGSDAVLFTSTSTVEHFVEALRTEDGSVEGGGSDAANLLRGVVVASIGPITSDALERAGLEVDVRAREFTMHGLLEALEAHFAPRDLP